MTRTLYSCASFPPAPPPAPATSCIMLRTTPARPLARGTPCSAFDAPRHGGSNRAGAGAIRRPQRPPNSDLSQGSLAEGQGSMRSQARGSRRDRDCSDCSVCENGMVRLENGTRKLNGTGQKPRLTSPVSGVDALTEAGQPRARPASPLRPLPLGRPSFFPA